MDRKGRERNRVVSRRWVPPTRHSDRGRVEAEIATLEARLRQIGHDGDCAYEKAMVRFFEEQVEFRRRWLEQAGPPPAVSRGRS